MKLNPTKLATDCHRRIIKEVTSYAKDQTKAY